MNVIVNTFSLDKIYDLREQDFYEVDRYHQKNFVHLRIYKILGKIIWVT